MQYACYTSMGHGNSFQREFFCYAGSAAHHSSQFSFCSSTAPSAMVLAYQHLGSLGISHSPFFSSLLWWSSIWCVDSVFSPADSSHGVHYRSIHMLARPPSSFTRQFRHSTFFRLSACPSRVRLCRDCLFGCRLVRAVFGYAEIVFSAVGLSEPCSAMPSLLLRSSYFLSQGLLKPKSKPRPNQESTSLRIC